MLSFHLISPINVCENSRDVQVPFMPHRLLGYSFLRCSGSPRSNTICSTCYMNSVAQMVFISKIVFVFSCCRNRTCLFQKFGILLKHIHKNSTLAGGAQWIECRPAKQRVAGSILSQGTCLGCLPGLQ